MSKRKKKQKITKKLGNKPQGPKGKKTPSYQGVYRPNNEEIIRPRGYAGFVASPGAEGEKKADKVLREEIKKTGFTVLRPGVRVNPATQGGLPKAANVKGKKPPTGDVIIRPATYNKGDRTYKIGQGETVYREDEYWEDWWGDTTSWQGKKQKGKSASSSWAGRFDNYSGYNYYGASYGSAGNSKYRDEEKFRRILRSISRTANVVNFDYEKVKKLKVQWGGDGRVNLVKDNTIYLSPNVIDKSFTRKTSWTEEELTDVLVGETLVQSAVKQTVSPVAESAILNTGDSTIYMIAGNIWHTMETVAAERAVLNDYPGFAAYFSAYHEYYLDDDAKVKVERFIKEAYDEKILKATGKKKGDGLAAMLAIQWEMLYPKDRLKMPDELRKEVNWALKTINKAEKPQARAAAALEIGEKFKKAWPYVDRMSTPSVGMSVKKYGDYVDSSVDVADKLYTERESLDEDSLGPNISDGDSWAGGTAIHKVMATTEEVTAYRQKVIELTPQITALRSKLKIRNEEPDIYEHGLRRGHLDDGSLFKLAFSDHPTMHDPKMFEEKTVVSRPDVAFGIMVDESGSMTGHKIASARDIAIVLSEALKPIGGVELCVMGHTAQGGYHGGVARGKMCIHEYYTPESPNIESLINIRNFCQNLDGYAVSHMAKQMIKWYANCGQKMLFLISDGLPHGEGYGGSDAHDHIFSVCRDAKASGINVFGIGIENAYTQDLGKRMYGANNFVVLNNVKDSMYVMSNFMTSIVRKSCAL